MAKNEEVKNGVIFPVGEKNDAYAQYFVGQSYLKTLVSDPNVNVSVGNVTFELDAEITGIFTVTVFNSYWLQGAKVGTKKKENQPNF